jgi:hypothetical protein
MSLEKQIEENTIALRELTAAIHSTFMGQLARSETTSQPLYDTVLSEFTALQSLSFEAAKELLKDCNVKSVGEVPASQYAGFIDAIADMRADVVKKLSASQESTIAPIAGTSSQEPASATGATTGGDEGKKPEQDAPTADPTRGADASAQSSTGDKPVFTEYQQVADEFLKLVKDKGRDAAIELLTAYGVKTAKELKPEQYQAFGEDVLRILGEASA